MPSRGSSTTALFLLVAAMGMLAGGVGAQAPAPAPALDCNTVLLNLASCLDYVSGQATKPSANCCADLSGIVEANPICLCDLFVSNGSFSGINLTLAANLPSLCKVQTLPVSLCSAVGIPVSGPIAASLSPTLSSPSISPGISPSGPKSTPSTSAISSSPSAATGSSSNSAGSITASAATLIALAMVAAAGGQIFQPK
eukprot:c29408_g1_i1 orf=129-722(+)